MSSEEDRIFAEERAQTTAFTFGDQVAGVFDNMIRRSLPGYDAVIDMLGVFARRYSKTGTCVYDLGCSLGSGLLSMQKGAAFAGARLIGVDSSAAMLKRCSAHLEGQGATASLRCENAQDVSFEPSSLIVLNFTLQFVPLGSRARLIQNIADALVPGGALVVSEKLDFESARERELCSQLHDEFRLGNGYTPLEIEQKRAALSGVLFAETEQAHRARLALAGFTDAQLWFRCCNFASFICVKP